MESNIGHIPRKQTLQIPINVRQKSTKLLKGQREDTVDWSLYWTYNSNLCTLEN